MDETTELATTGDNSLEVVATQTNAIQAMEAAAIDVQIATAHKYPRSVSKFMQRARDMVSVDKATAASCIYRRPVGKEGGRMKYVEGESIRMAEIVAATYGNLRVASIITEVNEREVKASAMCHDLENNVAVRADTIESVVDKNGKPFSERMRIVVAKAAQSKAIRDAIFRVVPKAMCNPIRQIAEDTALDKSKSLGEMRAGLAEWAKGLGVDKARLYAALGVDGPEEILRRHLLDMVGVRTAIENGEVTIDEAFPPLGSAPAPTNGRKKFGEPKEDPKPAEEEVTEQGETEAEPEPEDYGEIPAAKYVCGGCGFAFDHPVVKEGLLHCPQCHGRKVNPVGESHAKS